MYLTVWFFFFAYLQRLSSAGQGTLCAFVQTIRNAGVKGRIDTWMWMLTARLIRCRRRKRFDGVVGPRHGNGIRVSGIKTPTEIVVCTEQSNQIFVASRDRRHGARVFPAVLFDL